MANKQPDKKPQADLQEVVGPIRDASNILVTINNSPTVDQLAACIGLTLVLNKLGKHATAVFSGEVPSTLEFLKPEETLEKNTDSLRDFIIALDKSKADKLRYKVEDDVVKIFITPYKVSIGEDDLDFSQGDFNVDVVVALGVEEKKHLDDAILAHGRILHDATVIAINTVGDGHHLGSINWSDPGASSLCEMVTDIVQSLAKDVLDKQNSTALLTGIVAKTERYSNEKATPHTMAIAGALMSAGASTQLVSNELDSGLKAQNLPEVDAGDNALGQTDSNNGELDIDHTDDKAKETEETEDKEEAPEDPKEEPAEPKNAPDASDKSKDEYLEHLNLSEEPDKETPPPPITNRLVKDPPHFSGQLTANTVSEDRQYTGSTDPLTNIPDSTLLGNKDNEKESKKSEPPKTNSLQQKVDQTLREIEEAVSSPHLAQEETNPDAGSQGERAKEDPVLADEIERLSIEEARKAAELASSENRRPEARNDIGTTQLGGDIDHNKDSSDSSNPPPPAPPPITPLP